MVDEETSSGVVPAGWQKKADQLIQFVVNAGLDGAGPWKGAQDVADEILATARTREQAVDRLVATHMRMVTASGFLAGLGGLITLPVTVPADLSAFYVLSTRMVGGIAYLNGYDIATEEVRSVVLVSLIGAGGTSLLAEAGVQLGTKAAKAALKQVPGKILQGINRQVGFRLITKAGTTGVVNMSKMVPLVGGVAGAGINFAGIKATAAHARHNFVYVADASEDGEEAPTVSGPCSRTGR
ncbi:MAG: hypothetical protein QG671_519 [Actinomycetota bacterium]|nr:hypothetical protein [Actinomycetota bacterium]